MTLKFFKKEGIASRLEAQPTTTYQDMSLNQNKHNHMSFYTINSKQHFQRIRVQHSFHAYSYAKAFFNTYENA